MKIIKENDWIFNVEKWGSDKRIFATTQKMIIIESSSGS